VVSCRGIVVMVLLSWSYHRGLVVVAIVIVAVVSIVVSIAFVVAVVINHCCRCHLHCRRLLSPSWQRINGGAAMGASMAEKVVAQQRQRRRSNGNSGAATAMVVQQRLRRRSNGDGGAATAMAMAVQQWGSQWWWRRSHGGAAMVVDRSHCRVWYHRIALYSVFV
jgi:hypothetical protein